jgi:transcriptional regulator with XRE-family HTH domain
MNLNSKAGLIERLGRGHRIREQFVDSHLGKGISHQLRATRDKLGWSQEKLAKEAGMNQNAISRLESSDYGKPTITTLKRLAAAMDVGLIVRFVPFSEMVDWVSGTPRVITGLTTTALAVSCFSSEEEQKGYFKKDRIRLPGGAEGEANQKANPTIKPLLNPPPPLGCHPNPRMGAGF